MAVNLRGRSLLSLVEETPKEIRYLLDLAHDLKRAKYARQERQLLRRYVEASVRRMVVVRRHRPPRRGSAAARAWPRRGPAR